MTVPVSGTGVRDHFLLLHFCKRPFNFVIDKAPR